MSQQTEITDRVCQGLTAVNCEVTQFVKSQDYPGEPKLNWKRTVEQFTAYNVERGKKTVDESQ